MAGQGPLIPGPKLGAELPFLAFLAGIKSAQCAQILTCHVGRTLGQIKIFLVQSRGICALISLPRRQLPKCPPWSTAGADFFHASMASRAHSMQETHSHPAKTLPSTVHDPYAFIGTRDTNLKATYSAYSPTHLDWSHMSDAVFAQRRANHAWCLSTPSIMRI